MLTRLFGNSPRAPHNGAGPSSSARGFRPHVLAALVGLSTLQVPVGLGAQEPLQADTFALALAAHGENRLDDALRLLAIAVRQDPRDDRRWAYLADVTNRQGDRAGATLAARRALLINDCNVHAHDVLASAYNPQYSGWEFVDVDSTWAHLQAAIACDPGDGNPWLGVWSEAMRRGEDSLSQSALRALVHSGFLTEPWLTHARWVLESAPPRAILLTAGDIDTYPPLAVQAARGIRPDVVVINMPMLSLGWYARRLVERHGLPLPHPRYADSVSIAGDSLIAFWRSLAATRALDRPLLIAMTAGSEKLDAGPGRAIVSGPAFRIVPDDGPVSDSSVTVHALRRAESLDWRGPIISDRDRSPVRRAHAMPPAIMALALASVHGQEELAAGGRQRAEDWLLWAESFSRSVDIARHPYTDAVLAELRAAIRGRN